MEEGTLVAETATDVKNVDKTVRQTHHTEHRARLGSVHATILSKEKAKCTRI